MMYDFRKIERGWQKRWEKDKVFEADPDKRKKFFINFPYPYINAYLHLGHGFSATRVDVMARFKRMQGFNVLYPQAWHCTGTPVSAAALRIKEKEPKQLKIMKDMGFSDKEIPKFEKLEYWNDVFIPAAKEDFSRLGLSIDWRRSFITTELNPLYDRFIRWQFRKLKEKDFVVKGRHPVVWCPKDNTPVGDHDRVEGEGNAPQEFSLLKFKFEDYYLVAATLRPETVFGETNFWVNPDVKYVKVDVNGEKWIVSRECSEKLKNQDRNVKVLGEIPGKDLVGKYCEAPLIGKKIIILPAGFSDPNIGTGLVTSVPSDAPYDYIALLDLQKNDAEMKKYKLNPEEIKKIKPIPIIDSKEWGDLPAVKIVEKMQIKDQDDPKLEEATQIIYKAGFYSGKMNKNCGRYAGMPVTEAKDKMRQEMMEKGLLENFYELTGKVVCRCLTPSIVKIVSDQWFLKYGDKGWKDLTNKAVGHMKFYPDTVRSQFNYVIGWLNDWACTHHHGLGTRLPWDEKWVIESLSDSTIYMAYYTIAHEIANIPDKEINDEFFDYVFLGKGKGKKSWEKLRKEFEYWYPFDVRSSGKDLVQNHLTFCLFNHTAIFSEKHWPKSFSVNGWLLVEGDKMSKSKGNFYTIRQILDKYPADVIRASLMLGGEGLDDPNFNFNNVDAVQQKLSQWYDFAVENYKTSKVQKGKLNRYDMLFLSSVNRSVKESSDAMEGMLFRTAFDKSFYQMQKALRKYLKSEKVNQKLLNDFIEIQTKLLSPFCPHIAEEIWSKIGNKKLVSVEKWPVANDGEINLELEKEEQQVEQAVDDVRNIFRIVKEKQG
ncbi:MAG: leucine--tRNA ligase, partial [archaeon]